jgi:DNA-binding NtrC family response regulator
MVIEPDPTLRELFGFAVELAGFFPILAANSGEAVVKATCASPNVVLTEITEGSVATIEPATLAAIQNTWPGTPIILCTSHVGAGSLDAANSGFHSIVVKPFELDLLLTALRDAVETGQTSSERPA